MAPLTSNIKKQLFARPPAAMSNQENFAACRVFCTSQKRAAPDSFDQYLPITIASLLYIVVRSVENQTSSASACRRS
jgi:hypothetical protein